MATSYKQQKPKGKYNSIIIGSGMSGMALAAILAKEGKKCLVLERHYTPGGFTHVFKRRNYEWDVGVHYIGEVHKPNSVLRQMFDYISESQLQWQEMDANYDRIFFGKEAYNLVAGKENFINTLVSHFPNERLAIEEYYHTITTAFRQAKNFFVEKAMPPLLSKFMGNSLRKKMLKYASLTTREVLEKITQNQKLIGVLTGQYGDYGLPPAQSSFLIHSAVVKHYMRGGAFPVGGSAEIFNTVEPVINKAGGEVFTNAEVEKVIVKNGKAVGVQMADGETFFADKIISSVGAELTFNQLIKDESATQKFKNVTDKISASACHVCLYVGLNAANEVLKLPKTNYWIYPENEYNHDKTVANFLEDPDNAPLPVVYMSFPAAKDPTWAQRYPNRSTVELITITNYNWFKNWENTKWHKRGEDYNNFKEKLAQRLLAYMYEYAPQTKPYLDYYELSTPLSTKSFVNYSNGEIYGLKHTPERFNDKTLRAITPIKNFYLTGQDIATAGIGGALNAAVLTASAMLKKNMLNKILKQTKANIPETV